MPVLLAGMPASAASSVNMLGDLVAQGQVQIRGGAQGAVISITNDSHALFAGDGISTGEGTAILTIGSAGKIGLDKASAAKISGSASSLEVALEKGTVLYSVKHGTQIRIHAAGLTVAPASSTITRVAYEGKDIDQAMISGWVSITEDGLVRVSAHSGRAQVSKGGEMMNVVESGKVGAFRKEGGELIRVQAEAVTGGTATAGISNTVVFGVFGAATGVGVVGAASGGDDNDDNPASP